jgi:hypothetical protein
MNDDWRVHIKLASSSDAIDLKGYIEAGEVEHELEPLLDDRVVVSHDDDELFCYTGTREQAEHAESVIRAAAAKRGWTIETDLRHWHPVAEEWEDPDKPLPTTGAERAAEHEEMIEEEREESEEAGVCEWEVRVQLHSHRDASQLADKLEAEGLQLVRRWHYLVIGAEDEDTANALAQRIRNEAPDAEVIAEGSPEVALENRPGRLFSVFGGLGE